MARIIRRFSATVAAGTAKTSPASFDMSFPAMIVEEVEIVVPPGARGEVGFKLGSGGTQIIPYGADDFMVTDNEKISWPLEGQIDSGAWQLIAYNTGNFSHTIEVRFLCRLVQEAAGRIGFQPLPTGAIGG